MKDFAQFAGSWWSPAELARDEATHRKLAGLVEYSPWIASEEDYGWKVTGLDEDHATAPGGIGRSLQEAYDNWE